MIKKLYIIDTTKTNPYENLAREELLLENAPKDSLILYLWQNAHTVVIGKNQNPWKECNVSHLEQDGGFLARRLSGGGAVFHDLGNLNFTFIMPCQDYDIKKQLSVIAKSVSKFGISTEISGRNDILAEGKKFSGNAFCKKGKNAYHHGTILVDSNMSNVAKYLNPDKEKLNSNGVESIKSRVTNLKTLQKNLSVESMKETLKETLSEVYKCTLEELPKDILDSKTLTLLTEKYSSWDWRLGGQTKCDIELSNRFDWGAYSLRLFVNKGMIEKIEVYSDSMDCEIIDETAKALIGQKLDVHKMSQRISQIDINNEAVFEGFNPAKANREKVLDDIATWLLNSQV